MSIRSPTYRSVNSILAAGLDDCMSPTAPIEPEQFSLESFLRSGDRVVCGQDCAEPLTLTRRLVERCTESTIPVQVFVGTLIGDTFDHAPPGMEFLSYRAIGRAAERYSRLPGVFARGTTVEIPAYSAYLPEPGVTADIEQMALYAGRSCSLIDATPARDPRW